MCITLNISRSSYYEKSTRKISKTEIRREEIKKEVKSIFKDSKCRYGAPKKPKNLTKMRDKPRPSGRGRKARAPQVPLAM